MQDDPLASTWTVPAQVTDGQPEAPTPGAFSGRAV